MLRQLGITVFFILAVGHFSFGQDTVALSWCLERTALNHPRMGNNELIGQIADDRISNIKSGNLPQVELNGKASYQSDAISLDINIPIPGLVIPESPKDQYKLSLDLTQSLYDGGYSRNRQNIEKAAEKVEQSQLEIDVHSTKMQVKDLYYSILLIQKNQEIIQLSLDQLMENRNVIITGIKNGVLLANDLDLLDVEIIKLKQRKSELENSRLAGIRMLSSKTGEIIPEDTHLQPSGFKVPENDTVRRLEKALFDLQSQQLGASKGLVKSRTLPKVYAFGQFGYGNPALNMLKDEFDTYYIVGAGLKWTIWDWKTSGRDKEIIGLQQNMIESRKAQFESDIRSALIGQRAEINNHEENLKSYQNILELRSHISSVAKVQLEQGIIKTLDYITILNQETVARIQYENEKIILQQAIAKYLELNGEL
jgi:outer membrane protein TolC